MSSLLGGSYYLSNSDSSVTPQSRILQEPHERAAQTETVVTRLATKIFPRWRQMVPSHKRSKAQPGPTQPTSTKPETALNVSTNMGPRTVPLSGRFEGKVQLRDRKTVFQDLEIRFELEIEPQENDTTGIVRCRCLLDNLEARATRFDETISEIPYVLDILSVSISANGGQGTSPEEVAPVHEYFTAKQTETHTRGVQLGIGYTGSPQGQLTISAGTSRAVELSPICIAIRPRHIGAGFTLQEQIWEYEVQRTSQTWLELSKRRPPEHQATFRFSTADRAALPTDLTIRITVVSRRAKLFSGWKGVLSPHQWHSNWLFGHLKFALEAKILEDGEYFKFPTAAKGGEGGKVITFQFADSVGQGIPEVIEDDVVQCKLTCTRVRNRTTK
jgi:hypothetical protein